MTVFLAPSGAVGNAPANASSTAYEASHVAKAGAGTLYSVNGYNSLASTQFIQLHDAAAVPGDGAVPVAVFAVQPSSNFTIPLSLYGRRFGNGIVICCSTTGPAKTLGAANCFFDIQYL